MRHVYATAVWMLPGAPFETVLLRRLFAEVMTPEVFIKSVELLIMGETVLQPACLPFILGSATPRAAAQRSRRRSDRRRAAAGHDGRRETAAAADEASEPASEVASGSDPVSDLSPREASILRWLVEGHSNKSIARKIDIAEATVKVHVKAILRKIRVHNRTQAAIWAMSNGWLSKMRNGEGAAAPQGRRPHAAADPDRHPPRARGGRARCGRANAEVGAIHPKAMPVILTSPDEVETWMTAPADEALKLQRPLPLGKNFRD